MFNVNRKFGDRMATKSSTKPPAAPAEVPIVPKRLPQKRARLATPSSTQEDRFNIETFEAIAEDLRTGRIPKDRFAMTRDGLMVIMRNTGQIAYHAQYDTVGEIRTTLTLGHHPDMSLKEAAALTRTVRGLAEMGIDPQAGLRERLIGELKAKGLKWRP